MEALKAEAIALLKQLISIPSFSKEEGETAEEIANFLIKKGVQRVWIGKAENLLMAVKGKKAGTIIERQRYELY